MDIFGLIYLFNYLRSRYHRLILDLCVNCGVIREACSLVFAGGLCSSVTYKDLHSIVYRQPAISAHPEGGG